MRVFMILSICMLLQIANAQEAQIIQTAYETINLDQALDKQFTAENMDELLALSTVLPLAASVHQKDSEEWLADRNKSVGQYLKWYQKMFAAGFKLDQVTIMGAESARNIQKNNAIKSYLIAEQRLKRYMKNNFKGNKKKQFKMAMQAFGTDHDLTAEQISNKVINSEFGFVVYEKGIRVN